MALLASLLALPPGELPALGSPFPLQPPASHAPRGGQMESLENTDLTRSLPSLELFDGPGGASACHVSHLPVSFTMHGGQSPYHAPTYILRRLVSPFRLSPNCVQLSVKVPLLASLASLALSRPLPPLRRRLCLHLELPEVRAAGSNRGAPTQNEAKPSDGKGPSCLCYRSPGAKRGELVATEVRNPPSMGGPQGRAPCLVPEGPYQPLKRLPDGQS